MPELDILQRIGVVNNQLKVKKGVGNILALLDRVGREKMKLGRVTR